MTDSAHNSSTDHTTRRFDSEQQRVFLNLWRTYDMLRALEDELFGKYDLTPQQFNVLRLLKAEYPNSVPTLALASRLVTRAPDITRIIDKLEARGFVLRDRPSHNRRMVRIGITEAGLALVREVLPPLRECHIRQLGHLDSEQLKTLSQLLEIAREPHEPPDSPWRIQQH
ncbi:MarR family winged helix-turn-helix transcriptional regulator [Tuwongella immobilis]|uniref:HTH marR-type domain-containing protein n=1 Tax=Tuwongella immobilis TaxID=692036 RepID=A0A6C2YM62_9BACT|nr:MarR family transcriptional regulator [Tuwongella immobilis]VIP02447.1 family transcriptional regulator : Transcriptional regulator, MarR family OS=Pirellula staleyi (strain ATCC 27377 / DSM 6068 / ICPB 4128) GN=Psta_1502 PE=4 SV=1: MarR [Tuwongella immobilis]VTS01425.1 family transcriptional regulator : Transcriptional regulator, MarR family OS=Pirellula staleyi (strain ATCC 27377 / DSM 6068 / ICPB 4128) GN=Psta_1502 PE=4 SV=1: MarR [Tuwongella immobilis]